jgi:hypothetical protein
MAEVVNSLFGITPESLQAERNKALQTQALQYAQLDPFQRATAGIYAGANKLAGAVGGMLGAQDPEMMRLQQRQEMLKGVDLTNAESLKTGIKTAMQNRDYQLVNELTGRYQQRVAADLAARETESKITKNTAQERAAAVPADIQKAQRIAAIRAAVPAYKAAGDEQTVKLLEDELNALLPADKTLSFGAEAERYSRQFYNKPYADLTQAEMAKVNTKVEETAKDRSPKVINQLPGVEKAGDVTKLRKDLVDITKPYQDQSEAASDAIDLANTALKSNNFAAVASLSRSLAKAAGETQLSRADVEAFGIDPSLVGRVADTVSTLAQGRPTADTLIKLRQLSEAFKKKADNRIALEEQQLQETARVSGLFTEPQINTVFRRRPSNASAKTDFTSVKEAEAAKLPKGTIITINGRRAVVE